MALASGGCEVVLELGVQAHGLFALGAVPGGRVGGAVVLHGLYVQNGGVGACFGAGVYLGFVGLFVAAVLGCSARRSVL